ncbi:MAG: bifunctional non-ous end joining protein LigD [Thermoleophilaceae bacterium]|jgi:bifunctional non-homologous end joining protein LigD|nr:bifunctional non-ous end joining protein LigD [Thermoleophilaceae bacterium]
MSALEVEVEGKTLKLSNLDKVFYPETGFTKGQVVDYYTRVAPVLIPHLEGRPLTMKRYPNGVEGKFFYEKECPKHRPDWVRTKRITSRGSTKDRTHINFCVVDDLATLVWAANLADLEMHTSLSRVDDISHPTMVAFDLDPGPGTSIVECCQIALWLRAIFGELDIEGFPKTSGSKGLQVYVPLNSGATYLKTRTFALAVAELLERTHPDLVVSNMKKELRKGKVLVDWSQNNQHKTTVCVYSLRAKSRPTASTPVTWAEVEKCVKKGDPELLEFESQEVLKRVDKHGDLFAPVLELEQQVPRI